MIRCLILLICVLLVAAPVVQGTALPEDRRETPPDPANVRIVEIRDGLRNPNNINSAGDGTNRMFVTTKQGDIYVIDGDDMGLFLNVSHLLHDDSHQFTGERGLQGIAFHPNYAENGAFFIAYSAEDASTVLARHFVSDVSPNVADPNSGEVLLSIRQPHENHNGGKLTFGPDGYLYMGVGDGAGQREVYDPTDDETLLGSILRLDVGPTGPYGIPEDNPFVGLPRRDEVWLYGFRNPWQFSFDRATGDVYIGDVGNFAWEEVNYLPAGTSGVFLGWNYYEANELFYPNIALPEEYHEYIPPRDLTLEAEAVPPVLVHEHSGLFCAMTGGFVYRGAAIPDLRGAYLYGDFCSGQIFTAYRDTDGTWQTSMYMDTDYSVVSFGEDESGELYIVDYNGIVARLEAAG